MPWVGLVAQFSNDPGPADQRSAMRRELRFESVLTAARPLAKVVVLDLSEMGMMLYSPDELAVGETFAVQLPRRGAAEARVVWKRLTLYGCMFLSPVSRGVISAALLKASYGRGAGPEG